MIEHAMLGATIEECHKSSEDNSNDESIIISFQCLTHDSHLRDTESILIDTGSKCSVFNNARYLKNIRQSSATLRAYTNGGHQDRHEIGELPGLFPVWYNPHSMLNILSFSEGSKHFRITVDTDQIKSNS